MAWRKYTTQAFSISYDVCKTMALIQLGFTYGYSFSNCIGPSMLPTINEKGDFVLIDHFSYEILGKQYRTGDVIISISPYDKNRNICKRIVAMENEIIPIPSNRFPFMEYGIVPKGHVYICGDNPKQSTDSRQYGPIPLGLVKGRVICKIHNPLYNSNIIEWVDNDIPPWRKK